MKIDKKNPIRQVAKQAVLGLGFCMSAIGYARVLIMAISRGEIKDKKKGLSGEDILRMIIKDNDWGTPPEKAMARILGALGCSETVAIAAYWIHHYFNKTHPEFRMTAEWLVSSVETIASIPKGLTAATSGQAFAAAAAKLDLLYRSPRAPRREMINLQVEDDPLSRYFNVRVCCGPDWPATVCWREPHVRASGFTGGGADSARQQLNIMKSAGYPKPFTPQLAIENVTQAAARNAMCMGVAALDKMGYPDCIHIHDEVLLIVPQTRESVLAARDALLKALGPGHGLPQKWAILIKPDEVTVTRSLWEDEDDVAAPYVDNEGKPHGNNRWWKIEQNTPDMWDDLP
jgi:hypothetical protein